MKQVSRLIKIILVAFVAVTVTFWPFQGVALAQSEYICELTAHQQCGYTLDFEHPYFGIDVSAEVAGEHSDLLVENRTYEPAVFGMEDVGMWEVPENYLEEQPITCFVHIEEGELPEGLVYIYDESRLLPSAYTIFVNAGAHKAPESVYRDITEVTVGPCSPV